MTGPTYERGIVVGNAYDKYGSRNPLVRWMMAGFLASFDRLIGTASPERVLEVGCGPGDLTLRLAREGIDILGVDISTIMVDRARRRAEEEGLSCRFVATDLFELEPSDDPYDLVVCCEVLEHLVDPANAVRHLRGLTGSSILLSVPREPIWRALNMARGRYWPDFGNTPGHLQHWSRRSFLHFVQRDLEVVAEDSPFPWTMVLCKVPTSR